MVEVIENVRRKIANHWNKNWFAILIVAILAVVVISGHLSAKHAERMADAYYQKIDELERRVHQKISELEIRDKEAEKRRVELEQRLAVSNAKWDVAMRKYAEVRGKVYPTRPKDDKELLSRMNGLGYKAEFR